MEQGIIKMFRMPQGFGFIQREGQSDIFFHQSELEEGYSPREEDKVEFEVELQSDNRYRALNVRKMSDYTDVN